MFLEILPLLPVSVFLWIALAISLRVIVRNKESAKLTQGMRSTNPISWLYREFRRWIRFNISRFEFYKKLYDEITPDDYGEYMANIFETKLIITKPELVKLVSKNNFRYFSCRPRSTYFENDYLTHSIFNLDGKHWETWRKRLLLAFSNEKLEAMFSRIANCAEKISSNLFREQVNNEVDVNDISRMFVMTVFRCCVFGQEVERVDSNSEFAKMAKQFRHMDSFRFKFLNVFSCAPPKWRRIFGGLINANDEATEYFKQLITECVTKKENSKEKGFDFLSTFMEFEQLENANETFKWDRKATEAHCVVFLLGGFTATSSTIAFTLYELAKNPNVQNELKEEIDVFLGEGGIVSPEIIKKMTYLDNVINETLRKYPPFSTNVRICGKRCEMPENNLTVEKGKTVITPVSGLHHDPKYYPNPDVFDPKRFDGRRSVPACTYLPFGEGQRFAVLVVKTVIIKLLSQFYWSVIPGEDALPNFKPQKFTTTVSKVRLRYESRFNK